MGDISTVVQQSTRPKVQYALKFALKLDTYALRKYSVSFCTCCSCNLRNGGLLAADFR